MEQELPSSPPIFSGVRILPGVEVIHLRPFLNLVTRSLLLYVCFVDRVLSFCPFSFGHCVASSFSIYRFLLPLWYLQTLLIKQHFVSTIDPWSNKLVILRNEKHFVYIALLMTIIWWNWTHFRCIVTIYRYK